jgi:ankyrin repeat protein
MLISKGADVNRRRTLDTTPLHLAIGNERLFEFMLAHGGRIDSQSNRGRTPLHWAVESGQAAFAQFLVEKGASVNIQDNDGNTPLHLAAKKGQSIVCRMLLDHGADVTIRNKKGLLTLDYAEASGMRALTSDLTPGTVRSTSVGEP